MNDANAGHRKSINTRGSYSSFPAGIFLVRPRLISSGYLGVLPVGYVAMQVIWCAWPTPKRRSRTAIGMYRRRRHGRKGTMRRQLRWNSASARRRASVLRFPTSIPVHYSFHSYGMWPFTGDASSIFINLESRLRISASAPRRIRIDLIKSVRF